MNKKEQVKKTSIFIVNYSRYQIFGTGKRASEEQVRNKSGASEEQVKHIYKNDKECNKNDKGKQKKEPAAPLFDEEDDTEGIDLWGEDDDTVIRS